MSKQYVVNVPIKVPFLSSGLVTGKTVFTPAPIFMLDGVLTVPTGVTYTEIGSGLYTLNFTPATSGQWKIFIEGALQGNFEVVAKTITTFLQNIEDEAIGSWTWNKNTGALTLVRQDGTTQATFAVTDTLDSASRERTG